MHKKYIGRLPDDARPHLVHVTTSGKPAADKRKHAHLLLQVDAHGPHWPDEHGAQACRCHGPTVRNVRQRFVEPGLPAALARHTHSKPSRQRLLDGAQAAHWIARRCRQPPAGQAKWPLPWLADKLVELAVVEPISYATVRQTLTHTRATRTGTSAG